MFYWLSLATLRWSESLRTVRAVQFPFGNRALTRKSAYQAMASLEAIDARKPRQSQPEHLQLSCPAEANPTSRSGVRFRSVLRPNGSMPVFDSKGMNSTPALAGVQTANPANLGVHPGGSAMPRCRLPSWNLARKNPFRLDGTQRVSGSCIHAGMSRWPCSTRQTSMCSARSM